jgi:hypothetical protein
MRERERSDAGEGAGGILRVGGLYQLGHGEDCFVTSSCLAKEEEEERVETNWRVWDGRVCWQV